MAKRSSKKTRRATTKRSSTKRLPPARAAEGPGKYSLGREIGRGGLGRVVEAVDAEIGRTVALKLLLDGAPLDLVERFKREGRITARLEHPNIVPVHEVGHLPGLKASRGEIFFAMKKITGRDLADVLKEFRAGKGGWTLRQLVEIFRDVCRAMAFAHSKGVIHRDIKPSNVMVGEFGEVLVVDWGLAKDKSGDGSRETGGTATAPERAPLLTLDGDIFGTPDYMSPEQADGRIDLIDERSDVFSLGAVLYEILAGRPPFAGGTTTEILRRVIEGNPTRPTDLLKTLVPGTAAAAAGTPLHALPGSIPIELESVCLKALSSDRAARHPSALLLGDEIQEWLEGTREKERRERLAAERVADARLELDRWRELASASAAAGQEAKQLARRVGTWEGEGPKRALWEAQDRQVSLRRESVEALARADGSLASALSLVPAHPDARRLRAEMAWDQFLGADLAGDEEEALLALRVVERHNDGAFDARLRGEGSLSVAARRFPCDCLERGRDVPPGDMSWIAHHPWSGRPSARTGMLSFPELESREPLRLKVHGPACLPVALDGARVWAFRFEEDRRLLVPVTPPSPRGGMPVPAAVVDELFGQSPFRPRGPGIDLGVAPVAPRAWPIGSWLLVVAAPGRTPARMPVSVSRGEEARAEITLFREGELPRGFVAIGGGAFIGQGDPLVRDAQPAMILSIDDFLIGRDPVTCAEWEFYLEALSREDPALVTSVAPRETTKSPIAWPEEGKSFRVPTAEWLASAPADVRARDWKLRNVSEHWRADWPLVGIPWVEALRHARWRSLREGRLFTLAHDMQWEKAARGTDGRSFPWGRHFDGSFCNTVQSHSGPPGPSGVDAFPKDESPWGVRGMAGNVSDWCLDQPIAERPGVVAIRGGRWTQSEGEARCCHKSAAPAIDAWYTQGFRLAAAVRIPIEVKPVAP